MNEINIILSSEIGDERDKSFLKNDKTILFEKINNELHILDFSKKIHIENNYIDLISYKLLSFIENDDYIDLINNLDLSTGTSLENKSFEEYILEKIDDKGKESIFAKKIIIKKLLEFIQPIINKNDLNNSIKNINQKGISGYVDKKNISKGNILITNLAQRNLDKNNIIIDKNKITLNFPIYSKYITKINNNKTLFKDYVIPSFNYFDIFGLYNNNNLNLNVPYSFNQFRYELLNLLNNSSSKHINNIVVKDLKYSNKGLFTIDSTKLINLITLYKLILGKFELYINNRELYLHKEIDNNNQTEYYDLNKEIDIKNKLSEIFIYQEYVESDISKFNTFLTHKIGNSFLNNVYNSFDHDSLLNLYENLIVYSIDDEKIKIKIEYLKNLKKNEIEYKKKKIILDNNVLINNKLEHITKNKFPNLFNTNTKEGIFNQFNKFDINKLQKKNKDIVILEFKKNENYIKNYLYNKCPHKKVLDEFYKSLNKYKSFSELIKYIKKDNLKTPKSLYQCNICSFNLICPHIVDFYTLKFNRKQKKENQIDNTNDDYVHQKILNKYMTKAPIDMIYYCKICGEELGKSADIEQNIEYKDNIKINNMEYSDSISELILSTTSYIVYSYISFSNIGIKINKNQITKYIIDIISFYINNIEKKLRRGKNYDEDKINNVLHFNIIIFIYSTIIFMMNKYDNIIFNQPSNKKSILDISKENLLITNRAQRNLKDNIIIQKTNAITPATAASINVDADTQKSIKIKGGKRMNGIKEKFTQAYNLIINTNYILLSKLNYKSNNSDLIKEILIKSYNLINDSKDIEIDYKISNNLELIMNSPTYKYYFNIVNIYPIIRINKSNKRKCLGSMVGFSNEFISHNKKIKYDDYKNIIGDVQINKKPNYLFDKFIKPKFNIADNKILNIEDITEIKTYSEYKYYSFLLFCYYINNKIYELPIYEFLVLNPNISNTYEDFIPIINIYFQKTNIIKKFELNLINNNIIYNLYPYSTIKLNNSRYFYSSKENNTNLNIYICESDGKSHKFDIYIYKQIENKDLNISKGNLLIHKKDLDSNKNLKIIESSNFIDHECTKCHKRKKILMNEEKYDNSYIKTLIENKNDITNFYNIYRYKCPLKEYHQFNNKYTCIYCNISFKNILDEDSDIFKKFKNYYIKYLISIKENQNKKLSENTTILKKMFNTNIKETYKNEITTNQNPNPDLFINLINEMDLDDLIIQLSKLSNIDIKYFKILGLTEGYDYNDIDSIKISYDNIDNRFIKISNYIRILNIYYNLLININKISKYYDYDFMEILNKIKLTGRVKLINSNLESSEFNLINVFKFIKMTSDDNKFIIDFGLKMTYSFIIRLYEINKSKLNNILDSYIVFITDKIFKSDELYTNYSYAQLKKMFSENTNSTKNYEIYNTDDNEDDNEDDGLFAYNNIDVEFGDVED